MSKFSFTPLTADRASVSKINSIFEDIEANFARVVYRDEATSNSLQTNLDFNGNSIVNLGVISGDALTTKTYVDAEIASGDAAERSYADSTFATKTYVDNTFYPPDAESRHLHDVATLLADTTLTYTSFQPATIVAGNIVRTRKEGFAYEVAESDASDHHVATLGGVKFYVKPTSSGAYNALAFGAVGDGTTDSTDALNTFFTELTAYGEQGVIPDGTYIVRLGEIVLDNGHVGKPFPTIDTSGHKTTIFKAATNVDAPFIKITNGTAASGVGNFWQGGGIGGITFLPAAGSVSGLTSMHGLVLRGIEEAEFGIMRAEGIGANTVHIDRALYGGSNPDPYHVNRCKFEAVVGIGNSGAALYNDNYRGFAFPEIGYVFANQCAGGGWFGPGADPHCGSLLVANSGGWALGDHPNSTGGASSGVIIETMETDNAENGVDTQNLSEGLYIGHWKNIHRFQFGLNTDADYWPRISLRVGSSFRAVRDIEVASLEDRIESGGVLADLGVLADFMNAGGNLANVTIHRNVSDNASLGVTEADWFDNFSASSLGIYYAAKRNGVIDTRPSGDAIHVRNSGTSPIPGSGVMPVVDYDTIMAGNSDNYNTQTNTFTFAKSGWYIVRAQIALNLNAGTRVRMGLYLNGALTWSNYQYAITTNAELFYVETRGYFTKGQTLYCGADTNIGTDTTPGGMGGGVNDSFFSILPI